MSDSTDPPGSEQRRHPRHSLGYDAVLQTPKGARFDITIRDYSNGGLFASMRDGLAITTEEAAWNLQQDDVVIARIPLEPGRPPRIVPARVSRIEQTGFGLKFNKDQPKLVSTLQELGAPGGPEKVEPEPTKTAEPETALSSSALKSRIVMATDDYLANRVADLLEAAKDTFLVRASEAGNNQEQGRFFEAMGLLRKSSEKIEQDFLERVKKHFSGFETLEFATESRTNGGELSLVDEEEFEDWLALSELKNHYEQVHRDALRALELRSSQAFSKRLDDRNQPYSPLALSQHFYESIKPLGFASATRKLLLQVFGDQVLAPLTELYEELNQRFVRAGILPELPAETRKTGPSAGSTATSPGGRPPADGPAGEQPGEPGQAAAAADSAPASHVPGHVPWAGRTPLAGHGPDAGVSDKVIDLREILNQLGQVQAPPTPATPTRPISMNDLGTALDELRDLRQGMGSDKSQVSTLGDTLNQVLRAQTDNNAEPELSQPQSEAVYLTEQLMQSIGEDSLATPQAKQWADQLELPILRLLLQDQTALQNKKHPARQFINQLEQAASEGRDNSRDQQIVEAIDQVIDQIGQAEPLNEQAFSNAAGEIEQLLKRRRRLRDTQLKRLIEACEGQYKLEQARGQVSKYLESSMAGRMVPSVLPDLLDQGYRHLLELAQLRDDPDRTEWRQRVELLEQLQERLDQNYQAKPDDGEHSEQILGRLEQALTQASVEQIDRRQMIDRLGQVLPGVRPDNAPEPELVEFPSQPAVGPEPVDPETLEPEHAMWLGRAKMLDVGSWLLYPGEDGNTRPIKLAWVSENRERFVFVDRSGQKALEIGPEGLAEKLMEHQADVVDQSDAPLVDRSWQNMVQRMHEQIAHQATHDQLTDVLNRKEFERQLRLKIGESKLMHSVHGAFQFDLDQFNVLNANAGHEAGDQILRDVARILSEQLPDGAELARITGDAFATLIPKLGPVETMAKAEAMRAAIAEHRVAWKDQKLQATVSVGVVTIDQNTQSVSDVLAAMEGACQAAKESGRDRVRSFESDRAEIGRRNKALYWVNSMEDGLINNRLILHAQKIAPVRDSSLPTEHYEVLSRLTDEEGKTISPADFVPAAEAHGKIHLLDEWVLSKAFELLASSPRYRDIDRISLNISGKTFGRANFLEFVRGLFETTGVEPAKICFEITETAAVSNLAMCTDFLRQLRYLGCRFSLDDFGTGLSNFGYLKRLPVDYLKIDGSFVKEIATSTPDYGMVKTIHEIGNFLGKQTIAEYVENDQILEHLKDIGVDYAQGYGIAKPIPLTEVLGLS